MVIRVLKGHDFSRAVNAAKSTRASALREGLQRLNDNIEESANDPIPADTTR
jgi:hypothetical protein